MQPPGWACQLGSIKSWQSEIGIKPRSSYTRPTTRGVRWDTGALLDAVVNTDKAIGEGWRKRGTAFFQGKSRDTASEPGKQPEGSLPLDGGAASA